MFVKYRKLKSVEIHIFSKCRSIFQQFKLFRKIAPKSNLSFNHLNHPFTQNSVTKLFLYRNTIQKHSSKRFACVFKPF